MARRDTIPSDSLDQLRHLYRQPRRATNYGMPIPYYVTMTPAPYYDALHGIYLNLRPLRSDPEVNSLPDNTVFIDGRPGQDETLMTRDGNGVVKPIGLQNMEYDYIHTFTTEEVAAKSIALIGAPIYPSRVGFTFIGGTEQAPGVDFSVSGYTLTWTNFGIDTQGLVAAGDKARIQFEALVTY